MIQKYKEFLISLTKKFIGVYLKKKLIIIWSMAINQENTPLRYLLFGNNERIQYNKNDLNECIEHYCVAKPIDYMLRRTHLSWFQKEGGEAELDKIINNFDIPDIKQETIEELRRESLTS